MTIVIAMATALAQPLYFWTGRCPRRPSLIEVSLSVGISKAPRGILISFGM
jgi:hypothetical protein